MAKKAPGAATVNVGGSSTFGSYVAMQLRCISKVAHVNPLRAASVAWKTVERKYAVHFVLEFVVQVC